MNPLISSCEVNSLLPIRAIQQPRTDFQLKRFVVGQHDTEPRRWWQCVLELQIKIQNLKRAQIQRRQLERKIQACVAAGRNPRTKPNFCSSKWKTTIWPYLVHIREAETLYCNLQIFPSVIHSEELNAAEEEYWQRGLRGKPPRACVTGRVGVGNLDSLRQIGKPVTPSTHSRIRTATFVPTHQERSGS